MTTTSEAGTLPPVIALARRKRQENEPLPSPQRRREIREQAGLTQIDIAEVLGVTQTYVSHLERKDGFSPRRKTLVAYRKLLAELEAEVASWKDAEAEARQ